MNVPDFFPARFLLIFVAVSKPQKNRTTLGYAKLANSVKQTCYRFTQPTIFTSHTFHTIALPQTSFNPQNSYAYIPDFDPILEFSGVGAKHP
jgi:hypothetical protein